jgi:predicted SAM-dependent methyltransferase
MTWTLENSKCDEASKIRWECVPYFHGRVLDIGCGMFKCFPHWIGVDNGHHWGPQGVDVKCEATKLDIFASQSCDGVFSSHLLEHIPYEQVPATLSEWFRVIKQGGYLMLYLPDEDEYPKVGEYGANPDHKWNVNYDRVVECAEKVPYSWDLIEFEKRNEGDEYSVWFVFRKL